MGAKTLRNTWLEQLARISLDDLEYVEADLCFYEKVSISFLLFGDVKVNVQFILQKLLILSNSRDLNADILKSYATVNSNWKPYLIEALAIIKAKHVLRKLGFEWSDIREYYLPHIPEISVHINPVLKALYVMCEKLTPGQAGRLVLEIREQTQNSNDHLRFYDFAYLEMFLLDWMTRDIIWVNNRGTTDLRVISDYLKLNDMAALKDLLEATKLTPKIEIKTEERNISEDTAGIEVKSENISQVNVYPLVTLNLDECYAIRRDTAGIVLIINQQNFYLDDDPDLKQYLPPKMLLERRGTNIDKNMLKSVFSSFGYTPVVHDNLTNMQMLSTIREIVKRSILYDSLIVCILTHGIEGFVYGANSVPVKITEIERIVTGESLQGKPKMLIIQACQKEEYQPTAVCSKAAAASYVCATSYRDMVKAMSTLPGYASIRHTEKGTWFIQSICKTVDALGDRKHILDILTAVTRDVTSKRGDNNEVMVPFTSQTLTKDFFLPRRERDKVPNVI